MNNVSHTFQTNTCGTKNRVMIYTGGMLNSVVCPQPLISDKRRIAEVFSSGWHLSDTENQEDATMAILRDESSEKVIRSKCIFVEYLGKEDGQYSVTWLELGRR